MSDLHHDFNYGRYTPGDAGGFYESYFQRANHPSRPLAFWIRYTVFSPRGAPEKAIGELWAVWFDGERHRTVIAKSEHGAGQFEFCRERLHARIDTAVLEPGILKGGAESRGHRLLWDLTYRGGEPPLFLMAPGLYDADFPRAKSLVGLPLATYNGTLAVDRDVHEIRDWVGSQNHNWGVRHTDQYAYGQVAGFDNAPDSFLEAATGRVKLGPLYTPRMTPLVLRHRGREYALRSIWQAITRARGRYGYFRWEARATVPGATVSWSMQAPREAFVALRYYNPPGGEKICLNSKIASCRLTLTRDGEPPEVLETRHRAAFEILTDDRAEHGVEIRT